MKVKLACLLSFTIITIASCQVKREACLPSDNPWSKYEKAIDASQNCEQLQSVYRAFCKRLIALDGQIDPKHWQEYVKSTNFLERKMNHKGKKLCGFTFFDNILDSAPEMNDNSDGAEPSDDFDFEMWEDNFDYDEFDSNR